MSSDLHQVTAVITGASSGIGAATAEALAARGATVVLLARREGRVSELQERINERGQGRVLAHGLDVTDSAAVTAVFERIAHDTGGIDMLVNCAGIGSWAPALEADLADWHAMVETNVTGVLTTTHAALPHLAAAADGRRGIADIVTISSVGGRKVTGPNSNVYAATKHAVNAFTEALRQDFTRRHIRAGLIEPGIVTTEMTTSGERYAPDARNASEYGALAPEDVADAVVYMVSRPRHAAINEIMLRPTEQTV
ncbi:NADP-dependent 3-hydroxy acid dehydrogenase YdfG [Kushneria sinocarnis]|uniref:sulfoacetaldehyde reductase (NADPH) n=1 Tax=Kushneria sinocarnis TaxID=595502 RepID=A0A420X0B1_9GAMM|nr:SDR family oxidoreductase [Kushneria sinocarnis]RKR07286.1 NADP-dependent 3-hydroxy acid dehydrogenase YdfG [Kushneria sinocarnis]